MSLYDDLGVASDATPDEIKRAYRKAAKQHHPDAGGDPDAFARAGRAVAVLRDPARRAEYDRTGRVDDQAASPDNPDARAIAIVSESFSQVLNEVIEGRFDLTKDAMALIRKHLKDNLARQRVELHKAKAGQRRHADARKRLMHSGTGPDILGRMFDAQGDAIARTISAMQEAEKDFLRAIELSESWAWVRDIPEPKSAAGGIWAIDPEELARKMTAANSARFFHNPGA